MAAASRASASVIRAGLASLLCVLIVAPLALLLVLSVTREWSYPALWPAALQWSQWRVMLSGDRELLEALLRSLFIGVTVAIGATAAGFVTSQRIAAHRRRGVLLMLALLPFAISPVVLGVTLNYGFIKFHLAASVGGVIIAQFLFAYAYAVLLLSGFWNTRIAALSELAESIGADRLQIWWRVRVPLATGLLGVSLFQTFLISWFDFALARLIGAGRVQTLPLMVFDYFGSGDFRLAAACGVLLIAPPLTAVLLNRRLLAWPLGAASGARG
ncbi:MAG: ABC transporter permease [Gammaproteobacteria bacterium]